MTKTTTFIKKLFLRKQRITMVVLRCLVLALAGFPFVTTKAKPVKVEVAKQKAMSHLFSSSKMRSQSTLTLSLGYESLRTIKDKGATPMLYIFNINDDNGFVIVSGDDVTTPILGYCDKGNFSWDEIPCNLKAWIESYSDVIASDIMNGVESQQKANSTSKTDVSPLIKTQWNQNSPFNDQCIFNGKRCYTGCTATAMAQMMYYWATTGKDGETFRCGSTSIPSYTTKTKGYFIPELQAVESFAWNDMTKDIPNTTKSIRAVAQLMRYCGQAIEMDYTEESSAGSISFIEQIKSYFGYYSTMSLTQEEGKSLDEWKELIYENLHNGIPVVMCGSSAISGHSFVCDGYQSSSGKFHFNWGWGGLFDGWFAINALKVTDKRDYSDSQWAVLGVNPLGGYPYAVLSEDYETLTFYCDRHVKERKGIIFENISGWEKYKQIKKMVFDKSFYNHQPTELKRWFSSLDNLEEIVGLKYLNTSRVTDMSYLFYGCNHIKILDMSGFDTSKVTDMTYMFRGCSNLQSLDLSCWDTSNVTSMSNMFFNCSSLTSLDLSNFDTSKVTTMYCMFYNCSSLKSLDISSLNTANVTTMNSMFYNCSSLIRLDFNNFDTSNVTDMSYMFYKCSSLDRLNLSNFDTSNVTDMSSMFSNCKRLTFLDISNFDTSNAKSTWMFSWCSNLKTFMISSLCCNLNCSGIASPTSPCTIYAPKEFDFGVDTSGDYFMWNSGYFRLPDPEPYVTLSENGTVLTFYHDKKETSHVEPTFSLNEGSQSPKWLMHASNIKKVVFDKSFGQAMPTSTCRWFDGFIALDTIMGMEHLVTSEVSNMNSMFRNCKKLRYVLIDSLDTSRARDLGSMFNGCSGMKSLDFRNNDISRAENLSLMMADCSNLTSLYLTKPMEELPSDACKGVGKPDAPCLAIATFDFKYNVDTKKEYFQWKGGYFKNGNKKAVATFADETYPGENSTLHIYLDNGIDVLYGYQLVMMLPKGVSLAIDENGEYIYTIGERCGGEEAVISYLGDNKYSIQYGSNRLDGSIPSDIEGCSGRVLSLGVCTDIHMTSGEHPGSYQSVHYIFRNGMVNVLDGLNFYIPVLDVQPGDVNDDGEIDLADAVCILNDAVKKPNAVFIDKAADVNGDGIVDIADAVSVVNIVVRMTIPQTATFQ